MLQDSHSDRSSDQRIPPRYWWLNRILLVSAVYVLFLVGLRLYWGWEAERRLNAKIEHYRALGQPVLLEDFRKPPVPDEENAAIILRDVAAKLMGTSVDTDALRRRVLAGDSDALNSAKVVLAQLDVVLPDIRESRTLEHCDLPFAPNTPLLNVPLPNYAEQRELARQLLLGAAVAFVNGDHDEALEYVIDVYKVGARACAGRPVVIAMLVGIATDELAHDVLHRILPDLMFVPAAADNPRVRAIDRRAAKDLITHLLDEEVLNVGWERACQFERLYIVEYSAALRAGTVGLPTPAFVVTPPPGALMRALISPIWLTDAVSKMALVDVTSSRLRAKTFAEAASYRVPVFDPNEVNLIEYSVYHFTGSLVYTLNRLPELAFRARASRRLTVLALAIRLYEIDVGEKPLALEDLVPHYLPRVPRDPFDPTAARMRYLRNDRFPRVYSVWTDEVDDNGAFELYESGTIRHATTRDFPRFLGLDRPDVPTRTVSPSTAQPE